VTILEKLFNLFKHKPSQSKLKQSPLLIIKKEAEDANIKEYNSIKAAIADLEKDSNVSAEKIEKLKTSVKMLKDKTSIKIRNGELIK
jgi:septal ring factor EnvC (AmiA/AmiB activator)